MRTRWWRRRTCAPTCRSSVPCGTCTMRYMSEARDRLLDAAVEHAAHHGIGDLSLRQLAAALGTSHRMLVYHFGSKEGLLVAVVREVEARQRRFLADVQGDLPPLELGRQLWDRLADPAM